MRSFYIPKKNPTIIIIRRNFLLIPDVNECALLDNACDRDAECANTLGSYQCNCNAGYTGDGYTCSGESHHVYIENDSPTQIKVWSIKCDKLCSEIGEVLYFHIVLTSHMHACVILPYQN